MGIVVVTHDLGLAWNIADRIAVMYLGRVVECGTTEQVLEEPRHPYTQALLSVVPEIEQHRARRAHRARSPTRPASPAAAASTPAARSSPTAAPQQAGVDAQCVGELLPVIPATNEHRVACHLDAALTGRHRGLGARGAAEGLETS